MKDPCRVGVDLGGHTLSCGAFRFSSSGPELLGRREAPTPGDRTVESVLEVLVREIRLAAEGCPVASVGLAVPGIALTLGSFFATFLRPACLFAHRQK